MEHEQQCRLWNTNQWHLTAAHMHGHSHDNVTIVYADKTNQQPPSCIRAQRHSAFACLANKSPSVNPRCFFHQWLGQDIRMLLCFGFFALNYCSDILDSYIPLEVFLPQELETHTSLS